MTSTVLTSTGQVYCRMSLYWNLFDVFIVNKLQGYGFLRKRSQRESAIFCISYYTVSMIYDLDHLAEAVFVRFLHYEVTLCFPLFPYCTLQKEALYKLHLKSWELCSTSFRMEYLHDLFGIPLQEICLFSFPFVNFSLFISISMDSLILIDALGYNPTLL